MTRQKKKLTEREKKVLCALVAYPTKKDRDIAKITGHHLSTVTTIRRRLCSLKYYYPAIFPRVDCLGAELFTMGYGALNTTIPRDKRDALFAKQVKNNSRAIFALTSEDTGLFALINRNYTELKRDINEIEEFFGKNKITAREPLHFVTLSFKISNFPNYLDFSTALYRILCHQTVEKSLHELKPLKMRVLTKKEEAALMALVDNPTLSMGDVAKIAKMSRQTLAVLKARLLKEGWIRQANVPNMTALGCEIMTFTHAMLNPGTRLEDRKKGIELLLKETPITVLISGNTESLLIHFFKDYEEFNLAKNKIISYYIEHDFLKTSPKIILFSMKNIRLFKNFAYPGLLRYLLSKGGTSVK